MNSRLVGRGLTVLSLLAIGALTLRPQPELAPLSAATPVWCIVCGSHGLVDVVLNVLLFVPLGLGLALAGLRARSALIVGALVSLTVELLQLSVVSGRDASLSDLITNTLGAGSGALLALHWRAVAFPAPRAARGLTAAWAVVVLGVAGVTGISVAPSMPDPPYWGQWTPELGGMLQHDGTVESAHVEDIATPGWRVPASTELADSLADGELSAAVTVALAGPPERTAPIFRVVDGFGNQVLLVAQNGHDLIVETGTRSERLRLRGLTVRLAGAMPANERVRITAGSDRRGYTVSVQADGAPPQSLSVTRSASWGWALLLPWFHRLDERRHLLDGLWLGALMLPLGWWSRSLSRPVGGLVGGGATLVAALAAVPALVGIPAAAAGAWAGGGLGLVLGWVVPAGRRRASRGDR